MTKADIPLGGARFAALVALGIFFVLPASRANASAYEAGEPGPAGRLRVSRPTLAWKILPVEGTRISRVSFFLNSTPVPAIYLQAKQSVVYTPRDPLPPGDYVARCTVMLDGYWPVEREWRFTIAPDAGEPPAPDARQQRALALVNAYRQALALPPLRLDPRLCAAAAGHSAYLHANRLLTHDQQPGMQGFIGDGPAQRRAAFGYANGCFENLASGSTSVARALQGLFDAPYHRRAFLQPGSPDFGAGLVGDKTTLEIGATDAEGVVVYPADGQRDVPTEWSGNELPDPLWLHNAQGPVGYVISLFRFARTESSIHVDHAAVTTDAGHPVPAYLNTPDTDEHLESGILLIPRQPLRPGTTYHVAITARTGAGEDLSRSWRFTTAPLSQVLAASSP